MDPETFAAILAVLGIGLLSGGSASANGQESMIFKDYQWLILMPSTQGNALSQYFPGTMNPAIVSTLPPPPGQQAGSGQWVEYPGGYQSAIGKYGVQSFTNAQGKTVSANNPIAPGQAGNPIFPVFPDVPQGMSIFAWHPTRNVLTVQNGYYTMGADWGFVSTGGTRHHFPNTTPVLQNAPRFNNPQGPVPPPPGQNSHSGLWKMVVPGYIVWLTPQNTNNATLAVQSFIDPEIADYSTVPEAGGGLTNTAPTFTPQAMPAATPTPIVPTYQ
jgi:hypothetical protein